MLIVKISIKIKYPEHERYLSDVYGSINGNLIYFVTQEEVYIGGLAHKWRSQSGNISATLQLAITAEFPEEDTGYIEEGFDYCIDVGANLIASPCRFDIDIIDTKPDNNIYIVNSDIKIDFDKPVNYISDDNNIPNLLNNIKLYLNHYEQKFNFQIRKLKQIIKQNLL